MITTIQLSEEVKGFLDRLKTKKDTYEKVIMNLINTVEKYKLEQKELLIEGCKEMTEESLRISKEFERIENLDNWEW